MLQAVASLLKPIHGEAVVSVSASVYVPVMNSATNP